MGNNPCVENKISQDMGRFRDRWTTAGQQQLTAANNRGPRGVTRELRVPLHLKSADCPTKWAGMSNQFDPTQHAAATPIRETFAPRAANLLLTRFLADLL
jgi:hypothetical protein